MEISDVFLCLFILHGSIGRRSLPFFLNSELSKSLQQITARKYACSFCFFEPPWTVLPYLHRRLHQLCLSGTPCLIFVTPKNAHHPSPLSLFFLHGSVVSHCRRRCRRGSAFFNFLYLIVHRNIHFMLAFFPLNFF